MACDPASLVAISHLTNLESLELTALNYYERGADGRLHREGKEARIAERIWEMIRARKAGTPLPANWLSDELMSPEADRARRAANLEKAAAKLLEQIRDLQERADAILTEAKRLRAGD